VALKSGGEALAYVKSAFSLVSAPLDPRDLHKHAGLTRAEIALLMVMSLSGYRKWEQSQRGVSAPAPCGYVCSRGSRKR
jgi:putative transcriptional regulator